MTRYTITAEKLDVRQVRAASWIIWLVLTSAKDPAASKLTDSHRGKAKAWSPEYAAVHESRSGLPVYKGRNDFLNAVSKSRYRARACTETTKLQSTQVIIASAATGSGKSLEYVFDS
jgi:HrpA-like RNA helicase